MYILYLLMIVYTYQYMNVWKYKIYYTILIDLVKNSPM